MATFLSQADLDAARELGRKAPPLSEQQLFKLRLILEPYLSPERRPEQSDAAA